jgi:3-deoxy-D-manno-octulosonic-acid transferase
MTELALLYDAVYIIATMFYLPYYLVCLLLGKKSRSGFLMRIGIYPKEITERLRVGRFIWVHAVSVGEVITSSPMLNALRKSFPELSLLISTITPTGYQIAKRLASEKDAAIYLPLDFSFLVSKVQRKVNLSCLLIFETEIWPNLIAYTRRRGVPVIVMNGRISPVSYRRYRFARFLVRPMLQQVDLYCMQTQRDADYVISLGAPSERVFVTGNIKYDMAATESLSVQEMDEVRRKLSLRMEEILLVGGSTHRGEEDIIFDVYRRLKTKYSNLRLLVAPRHVERVSEVENIALRYGLRTVRFSGAEEVQEGDNVIILDMMGRLRLLYSVATVVFVGGSLIPHGGQNMIEPASFGKPVIFGPHIFNFHEVADHLLRDGAAYMVHNKQELYEAVDRLLRNADEREKLGSRAKTIVMKNIGATSRNMNLMEKMGTHPIFK